MSSTGRNRRKIKNLLQKPKFQVRFGIYLFLVSAFSAVALQMVVLQAFQEIIAELMADSDIDRAHIAAVADAPLQIIVPVLLAFLVAYAISFVILGIYLTHRIVGPMVPIRRHIEALSEGKYGITARIRKKDDLHELVDLLNTLSQKLAQRHGSADSSG